MKNDKTISTQHTLDTSVVDVLRQQVFNVTNAPLDLADLASRFQSDVAEKKVDSEIHLTASHVHHCEIRIGNITFDLSTANADNLAEQVTLQSTAEISSPNGTLDWEFNGVNQFGSVTIRARNQTWNVLFSRLHDTIERPAFQTTSVTLASHQAIEDELAKVLQPIASSAPTQTVILQGAPGLGKSHCAGNYVYRNTEHRHQMIAWLSAESEATFLKDWAALANQLRYLEGTNVALISDDDVISKWCENKLGQWLFVIDDIQVEFDWLMTRLPKIGGHLLLTTSKPNYSLPENAHILMFYPLTREESTQLLQVYLGDYWQAAGYAKEEKALEYLSVALGGSPALLTQMALLARKKSISFARIQQQLQEPISRQQLLEDNIFGQLKGRTFIDLVQKSWECVLASMSRFYPTLNKHQSFLIQFINVLTQETKSFKDGPCVQINDKIVVDYWQAVWMSCGLEPIDAEKLCDILSVLPLTFNEATQNWSLSIAGLQALNACTTTTLNPTLTTDKPSTPILEEARAMPDIPPRVHISTMLEDSAVGHMDIALFNTKKLETLKSWCLPTVNPYFIPRPKLTEDIKQALPERKKGEHCAELLLAAASGMGGIGKTELARDFITNPNLSGNYQARYWLNAETVPILRNEFISIASQLGLIEPKKQISDDELIGHVHRWLNINAGWLMILDNADNYNAITDWIPKEGGAVLVTTREPNPGTLPDKQIVRVTLLEPDEALKWLFQLACRTQQQASDAEFEAAKCLIDDLGCLPLAIAQAAAYLREHPNVSIVAYHKEFKVLLASPDLASQENCEKGTDAYARKVVGMTWSISLKAIEQYYHERDTPNLSKEILSVCAYLAPKNIPVGFLQCWLTTYYAKDDSDMQNMSYFLDEFIGQSLRYSLLERNSLSEQVSVHRLLQVVIRQFVAKEMMGNTQEIMGQKDNSPAVDSQNKEEERKSILYKIGDLLVDYSEKKTMRMEEFTYRTQLIPHFDSIIKHWSCLNFSCTQTRLVGLDLQLAEAVIISESGDYALSLDKFKDAFKAYQAFNRREFFIELQICINLSITYDLLGDTNNSLKEIQKAESIFNKIKADLMKSNPTLSMRTSIAMYVGLGKNYMNHKQPLLAKTAFTNVLNTTTELFGEDSLKMAEAYTNLGAVCCYLSEVALADKYLKESLRLKEKIYGDQEHIGLASTLTSLGVFFAEITHDAEQQKFHFDRALKIQEKYYGEQHIEVALSLENLGNANKKLGDTSQAKKQLNRALSINKKIFGQNHPRTIKAKVSLAAVYVCEQETVNQGVELLNKVKTKPSGIETDDNRSDAIWFRAMAKAQETMKNTEKAIAYLEKALSEEENIFGENNLRCADIYLMLGKLFYIFGLEQSRAEMLFKSTHYSRRARDCFSSSELFQNNPNKRIAEEYLKRIKSLEIFLPEALKFSKNSLVLGDWLLALKILNFSLDKIDVKIAIGDLYFYYDEQKSNEMHEQVKKLSGKSLADIRAEFQPDFKYLPCCKLSDKKVIDIFSKTFRRAAATGNLREIRYLTECLLININAQDDNPKNQRTALHWAVIKKKYNVVRYLVDKGARINILDAKGKTALNYAKVEKKTAILPNISSLLREYKLKDDTQTELEKGLHNAAHQGNITDMQVFIRLVNNIDAQGPLSGSTALHHAVTQQRTECEQLLREAGATDTIANSDGKYAEDFRVKPKLKQHSCHQP